MVGARKRAIVFLGLVVMFGGLHEVDATEIYMVPMRVYSDNLDIEITEDEQRVGRQIFRVLEEKDTAGLLAFRFVGERRLNGVPHSTLDAALTSEELQVRYLLYGSLRKSQEFYDAQIRLFDNETKQDEKVFYARAGRDALDVVVESLASQTAEYVQDLLGVTPERIEERRRFGGLGIHASLGYWFPVGQFGRVLSGIATAGSGASVIPVTPLYRTGDLSFYVRYGMTLSYAIAINKPEFVPSVLHSFLLRAPVDASFEYLFNHVFYVGVGPLLRIDISAQQPLYDDAVSSVTSMPGFTGRLGYEYWFHGDRDFALGVHAAFDAAAYQPWFLSGTVQFYSIFQLDMNERPPASQRAADGG